ncbi:MAG: hypothetical protein LBT40_11840 [Deltaproteobacteria bacterium]|nr:hypothetical protein [Deltaproteobacteria bacterium]
MKRLATVDARHRACQPAALLALTLAALVALSDPAAVGTAYGKAEAGASSVKADDEASSGKAEAVFSSEKATAGTSSVKAGSGTSSVKAGSGNVYLKAVDGNAGAAASWQPGPPLPPAPQADPSKDYAFRAPVPAGQGSLPDSPLPPVSGKDVPDFPGAQALAGAGAGAAVAVPALTSGPAGPGAVGTAARGGEGGGVQARGGKARGFKARGGRAQGVKSRSGRSRDGSAGVRGSSANPYAPAQAPAQAPGMSASGAVGTAARGGDFQAAAGPAVSGGDAVQVPGGAPAPASGAATPGVTAQASPGTEAVQGSAGEIGTAASGRGRIAPAYGRTDCRRVPPRCRAYGSRMGCGVGGTMNRDIAHRGCWTQRRPQVRRTVVVRAGRPAPRGPGQNLQRSYRR